jgi:hypothetical protein
MKGKPEQTIRRRLQRKFVLYDIILSYVYGAIEGYKSLRSSSKSFEYREIGIFAI